MKFIYLIFDVWFNTKGSNDSFKSGGSFSKGFIRFYRSELFHPSRVNSGIFPKHRKAIKAFR